MPVKGGKILDMRTLELRDRTAEDAFTYEVEAPWLPEADTTRVEAFFSTMFLENQENLRAFQRLLGYTLAGGNPDQIFALCLGPEGSNGKSALQRIIKALTGVSGCYTEVHRSLVIAGQAPSSSSVNPYHARLAGKRWCMASEPCTFHPENTHQKQKQKNTP